MGMGDYFIHQVVEDVVSYYGINQSLVLILEMDDVHNQVQEVDIKQPLETIDVIALREALQKNKEAVL